MGSSAPMLADQDPNPEKWIGIGGFVGGLLMAIWAKVRWHSKEDIEKIVDARLEQRKEQRAIRRFISERDGDEV